MIISGIRQQCLMPDPQLASWRRQCSNTVPYRKLSIDTQVRDSKGLIMANAKISSIGGWAASALTAAPSLMPKSLGHGREKRERGQHNYHRQ